VRFGFDNKDFVESENCLSLDESPLVKVDCPLFRADSNARFKIGVYRRHDNFK